MNQPNPQLLALALALAALWYPTIACAADPVPDTVLANYGTQSGGPNSPRGGLVEGKDGTLYGVSQNGGSGDGQGSVFSVPPGGGSLTVLHSFNGPDGSAPEHGLAMDAKGVLYGTTRGGGAGSACGTVFSVTPTGVFKTLHSFQCDVNGGDIDSNVVFGNDGFLYGISPEFGPFNSGLVFRLAPDGSQFSVAAAFDPSGDGEAVGAPEGGLMLAQDGSFYGIALFYRSPTNQIGSGAIYRYTPGSGISIVYGFANNYQNPPGAEPPARDAAGNLYLYGPPRNSGMVPLVYRVSSAGALSVLHSFSELSYQCSYGNEGSILLDADGRLYGEAGCGGTFGQGFAFSLTTDGSDLQVLHSFASDGVDVEQPGLGLIANRKGGLSAQTYVGGSAGIGGVYHLIVPTVSLNVKPAKVAVGKPATLTWSSTDAAECAASGAWGPGAEPLSGSVKVTPAAAGSYTFTLACNGAGTASRSVVLTVQ